MFHSAAIHSGPSYGLARNAIEGQKILKEGPEVATPYPTDCTTSDYNGRILVIHGSADTAVNPKHVDRIMADFV